MLSPEKVLFFNWLITTLKVENAHWWKKWDFYKADLETHFSGESLISSESLHGADPLDKNGSFCSVG